MAGGRTLLSKPQLYEEEGERSADWWELFVDLIIVAACSKVADGYKEDLTGPGLLAFIITFSLFQTGWHFYVFFNTRFMDHSLFQSGLLFVYMIGTAGMVATCEGFGEEDGKTVRNFSFFMLIQRASVFSMFALAALHIDEARKHASMMAGVLLICMFTCVVCMFASQEVGKWIWIILAIFEHVYIIPVYFSGFIKKHEYVPVDIEHSNDRQGCLIMVVLGESVVTAVGVKGSDFAYFGAMILTLFIAFNFGLNYYHVKPPLELHAFSKGMGKSFSFIQAQNLLSMSLLAVGTGLKFAMDCVVAKDPEAQKMPTGQLWVLFGALSIALLAIVFVRMLHYFGHHPRPDDPPHVRTLKWFWWGVSFCQWIPPLVCAYALESANPDGVPPLTALGVALSCITSITIIESAITHTLHEWDNGSMEIQHPGATSEGYNTFD